MSNEQQLHDQVEVLQTAFVLVGGEACTLSLERVTFDLGYGDTSVQHCVSVAPTRSLGTRIFSCFLKDLVMEDTQEQISGRLQADGLFAMLYLNMTLPMSVSLIGQDGAMLPAIDMFPTRCEEADITAQVMLRLGLPS